jgi:hypothetical protein
MSSGTGRPDGWHLAGSRETLRTPIWLAWRVIPRPGIFVTLLTQPWLNPALPVPFLLAHDLPHHGDLAVLIDQLRVMGWLAAGTAWRRFPLTHDQILLQDKSWLSTRPGPLSRGTGRAVPG